MRSMGLQKEFWWLFGLSVLTRKGAIYSAPHLDEDPNSRNLPI